MTERERERREERITIIILYTLLRFCRVIRTKYKFRLRSKK